MMNMWKDLLRRTLKSLKEEEAAVKGLKEDAEMWYEEAHARAKERDDALRSLRELFELVIQEPVCMTGNAELEKALENADGLLGRFFRGQTIRQKFENAVTGRMPVESVHLSVDDLDKFTGGGFGEGDGIDG